MSGVVGAPRIKTRADFIHFMKDYQSLISQFPGFKGFRPSGSYNSNLNKQDFGDMDLITHFEGYTDKTDLKKKLVAFFTSQPETKILPFTSVKHVGKRTYNSGEIVSIYYYDDELGYGAQIDNIIALDQSEANFKQQFLDMPAEKQGLVLGLVKIALMETNPQSLFKSLGIKAPPLKQKNQEYEFNLSSVEIQLRKVTYKPGTYEQIGREIIWTSRDFNDLQKILYQYDLNTDFDTLLAQAKAKIKNPRSSNRMQGVFSSMITVKSGEVGTPKGAGKEAALAKIQQTFKENRRQFDSALLESNNRKVIFAFGRFQPPTIGHVLLINKVKELSEQQGADYVIYVSKTQDNKSNPLSIEQKISVLQKMFPGTNFKAADATIRTPIEAIKNLNQKYNEIIWVAGDDRIPSFSKLLNDYNGKEYDYDSANVVSSGSRDPDSDGAEGMSGTKMREAAIDGDFEKFRQGIPTSLSDEDTMMLMDMICKGMAKVPKNKLGAKKVMESYYRIKKIKEFILKTRPMLKEASVTQKEKLYRLLSEAQSQLDEPKNNELFMRDPELDDILRYAEIHYPGAKNRQQAFVMFVLRSLKHAKQDDEKQDAEISDMANHISQIEHQLANISESTDYLDEK